MIKRALGFSALLGACFAIGAAPAPAQTPSSWMVPVTQPDDLGQPVSIDTDVYLPDGSPPSAGWPLVVVQHGGGGSKSGGFEVFRAKELARNGYAAIVYSARGHGDSGGQVSAFGPKELRDLFDVLAWALGTGGRNLPEHPDFQLDRTRIGSFGESQGGLHTNLGQVHADDPAVNPYGIGFRALEPGNTPDIVYEALVQDRVVKLSYGAGLIETYLVGAHGHVSPILAKWIATLAGDQPALTPGEVCDSSGHDTETSSTLSDLAYRSPGCFPARMTLPTLWSQAFDDGLFPVQMATSMFRQMPNSANRLYLTMGGHAAPSRLPGAERDQLDEQIAFFDAYLKGTGAGAGAVTSVHVGLPKGKRCKRRHGRGHGKRRCHKRRRKGAGSRAAAPVVRDAALPRVVYWRRDPRVGVPNDSYAWPAGSWDRHTSDTWPPAGTADDLYELSANGQAIRSGTMMMTPTSGTLPLAPLAVDTSNDPVAKAALSATPVGTSPLPAQLSQTDLPGFVAAFETSAFGSDREIDGQVRASLAWTPLSADSQLVVKLLDRAPDGTLTLLTRGVAGVRGATPGVAQQVAVETNEISSLVPAGHTLLAWVSAGELPFYKAYAGSLGGALGAGPSSTLTIPLRTP